MIKKIIFCALLANASTGHSQVFFSEDFSSGNASSWTNTDNDSDNSTMGIDYDLWYVSDAYAGIVTNSDGFAAASHSQAHNGTAWVPFNPNNFLISPQIDLTTASSTDLKLKFDIGSGQLAGGHAEHYAVYVTNSNVVADIELAIPVFEETLPTTSASNMESHVIDISTFAGQNVYITIRHFNCTNQFNLLVDNIIVEQVIPNNASITSVELNRYSLTSTNNQLDINIVNEGSSPITSIEIDWNDGTSHTSTISGLNIAPFATQLVSHPVQVSYPNVTEEMIAVSIIQVNGVADVDPIGNNLTVGFNTISTHVDKNVVFEEGTGAWCPSCPSGAVMMETMYAANPNNFIGIAVHVQDIMTLPDYESESDFVSVPKFHADRKIKEQAIANATSVFNELSTLEVPAELTANVNVVGSDLEIIAEATFNTLFSNANFRLGVIITEDHVTGTTSAYDQANTFAGGAFGPMGGYENLPNPVPASQMVYDHVGRALIGGYDGQVNSIPATIAEGQVVNYTFNYTIPTEMNSANLNVVLVMINETTGEIVCASTIESSLSVATVKQDLLNTNIFPNPSTDIVNISFNGFGEDCLITIYDITGKEVLVKSFEKANGQITEELSVQNLNSGSYLVTVSNNRASSTKQLIIQ